MILSGCGSGGARSVHYHPGCVADHASTVPQSAAGVPQHPAGTEPCRAL